MTTPRITIAMPMYNGARFLRPAIESLLAQTLGDFRFVCLDDASTDDSVAIASQFRDSRLTVETSQRHTSLPVNWNRALDAASGDYLLIAHQDDVYDPAYLATTVHLLDTHSNAFAAHTKAFAVDEHGDRVSHPAALFKERFWPAADPYERTAQTELRVLLQGNYIVAPAVLLRVDAIRRIGRFDERFHFVTDWDYWLRGLEQGFTIAGTHAPLVSFRRHAATATRASEVSMRRYDEERDLLARFVEPNARLRPVENTLLADFCFRLAHGDASGARALIDYAETHLPRFRGSPRDRLMRVAIRGGWPVGKLLEAVEHLYIRAARRLPVSGEV